MPNGVFRRFNQSERPLSFHLKQRFERPLLERVQALPAEALQEDTARLVRRLIDQVRIEPPQLLGQEAGSVCEGEPRPTERPEVSQRTIRYYVAVQVAGDVDVLEHWPDEAGDDLRPVDHDLGAWAKPWGRPSEQYDLHEELRRHDALLAQDRWTVRLRSAGGPRALYTFVDLTDEEIRELQATQRDPGAEVTADRHSIEPIVTALAAQVTRFFDEDLPERLASYVEEQKTRLAGHRAVLESLSWPEGWKYPQPTVELGDPFGGDTAAVASAEKHDGIHARADMSDASSHMPSAGVQNVHLGRPTRLSDASFADLLRTMRVWADAVERHPKAYWELHEERISDLLVATLNAALPGAHREVYNRGGKTDFYVRADTVATGAAPARIFIGECKKWSGPGGVDDATDQLFGYLTAHDTASALLFLVPLVDGALARTGAMDALQNRVDYVGTDNPEVEGWPILRFHVSDKSVRVCVAFIDLPPHG